MEIENSGIYNEIQAIIDGGPTNISNYWVAQIHTPDLDTEVFKVLSINNFRDYEKNIGDETTLEVMVPLGVYAKIIYINRAILEISLQQKPLGEISTENNDTLSTNAERYKAVLVLDGLPPIEGTELGQLSQSELDLMDILVVRFQLFNRSLEKLRIVTVGGIYRKTTPEKVIKAVLSNESSRILVGGDKAIEGVDMVEANNQETREQFIIPQGTKLTRVPTYIQERCGGVYNSGIGTYFQSGYWYVYPLYDTTKITSFDKTLTLIKVPKNRFTGLERTYREDGGSVFVIGTEKTRFTDDGSTNFMIGGNGVRLADADSFMNGFSNTKNNKAVLNRGKNNYEFISRQKDDGVNNVVLSDNAISSNPFVEYSKLVSRDGGLYEFVWENSKPDILFPGMRTKVFYLSNNELIELSGILLASQSLTQLAGTGINVNKHITTTHLTIFVNKTPVMA